VIWLGEDERGGLTLQGGEDENELRRLMRVRLSAVVAASFLAARNVETYHTTNTSRFACLEDQTLLDYDL
jgi:hypothetical protein